MSRTYRRTWTAAKPMVRGAHKIEVVCTGRGAHERIHFDWVVYWPGSKVAGYRGPGPEPRVLETTRSGRRTRGPYWCPGCRRKRGSYGWETVNAVAAWLCDGAGILRWDVSYPDLVASIMRNRDAD